MMIELLKKSLNIPLMLFLLSCSVSAPVIRDHNWDITVVQDKKLDIIYEQLSIFVNCYDEDGENDIETIFFIDDENGIYWELNEENWDFKYIGDVKWIGSLSIIMPDRSNFPRVPLRIHVRDFAGESVEDKLYISKKKIDLDSYTYPELLNNNGNYSIKNNEKGSLQIVSAGKVLTEGSITSTPESFFKIFGKNRDEYENNIEFFVIIEEKDLNIKSGPWFDS